MKPDYSRIRQLEYELGFEERPGFAAIALLKEMYTMPPGIAEAAAMDLQRATEGDRADR
jgi:hypothetical protein